MKLKNLVIALFCAFIAGFMSANAHAGLQPITMTPGKVYVWNSEIGKLELQISAMPSSGSSAYATEYTVKGSIDGNPLVGSYSAEDNQLNFVWTTDIWCQNGAGAYIAVDDNGQSILNGVVWNCTPQNEHDFYATLYETVVETNSAPTGCIPFSENDEYETSTCNPDTSFYVYLPNVQCWTRIQGCFNKADFGSSYKVLSENEFYATSTVSRPLCEEIISPQPIPSPPEYQCSCNDEFNRGYEEGMHSCYETIQQDLKELKEQNIKLSRRSQECENTAEKLKEQLRETEKQLEVCEENTETALECPASSLFMPVDSNECATFDFITNTLHIPCFEAGSNTYWLDMKLFDSQEDEILLQLTDYGKN